jgi:hypothetical protein
MINWDDRNWRDERTAWQFAVMVTDDLLKLRPTMLRDLGWAGISSLRRCLMAAWLSRQQ